MKKPTIENIKATFGSGWVFAKERGEPIATGAVKTGRAALGSKLGKRVATGAVAGGAIAAAVPFLSVTAGVLLGAGALVLYKSFRDADG